MLKFFIADPDPGWVPFWSWIRDGKVRVSRIRNTVFFIFKYSSIRVPCLISYRFPRGFRPWSFEISSVFELRLPFCKFQCCAIRTVPNQDLYLYSRLDESGSAQEITPNVKEEDLGEAIEEPQKQEQGRSENESDNGSNR
jgi:hypothetical protein